MEVATTTTKGKVIDIKGGHNKILLTDNKERDNPIKKEGVAPLIPKTTATRILH